MVTSLKRSSRVTLATATVIGAEVSVRWASLRQPFKTSTAAMAAPRIRSVFQYKAGSRLGLPDGIGSVASRTCLAGDGVSVSMVCFRLLIPRIGERQFDFETA